MVPLPIVIVIVLVVGAASFFAGTKLTGSSSVASSGNRPPQMAGATGTARNQNGNQIINGDITAADTSSITVTTQSGSSQIILLTSSTTYKKMADSDQSDLVVGKKVMITGTKDSSGSVTATQISTGVDTPIGGGPQNGDQSVPPSQQ